MHKEWCMISQPSPLPPRIHLKSRKQGLKTDVLVVANIDSAQVIFISTPVVVVLLTVSVCFHVTVHPSSVANTLGAATHWNPDWMRFNILSEVPISQVKCMSNSKVKCQSLFRKLRHEQSSKDSGYALRNGCWQSVCWVLFFLIKSKQQLRLINSRYGSGICVPEAAREGQRCPATLLGRPQDAEHSRLSSAAGELQILGSTRDMAHWRN